VTTTYEVVAHNTATQSDNKIHDDEVARRFGFTGGLVPGVDVYAYLTHLPAATWGLDWLERGTMRGRFHTPVYEGDRVTVEVTSHDERDGGPVVTLELRGSRGELCAVGKASLPPTSIEAPSSSLWADVAQATKPPPASPLSLVVGTAFGLAPHGFHVSKAGAYLDDVRESSSLYRDEGVAHPGWLLRDANYVLSANVRLGPWIHVESVTQHHAVVRDGAEVQTRALVTREWEHKGHRFVELDVAVLADDEVANRITHTAIYQPRQVAES
jgi:acyl dehydratase